MGMLRRKTRILCTHHIKFLAAADVVVVMEDGRISMIGKIPNVLSFVVVVYKFQSTICILCTSVQCYLSPILYF